MMRKFNYLLVVMCTLLSFEAAKANIYQVVQGPIEYYVDDETGTASAVSLVKQVRSITFEKEVNYKGHMYQVNAISGIAGSAVLDSVFIPKHIKYIKSWSFHNCTELHTVIIEDNEDVLTVGGALFGDCPLRKLYIGRDLGYEAPPFRNFPTLETIEFGEHVTNIGVEFFQDCVNLKSVIISDSVDTIGNHAFYNCSQLTSLVLPKALRVIDESAFQGCKNLSSVIFPDGLETIGNKAFYGCKELAAAKLGSHLGVIGDEAFYDCDRLAEITIPESVTKLGASAFESCKSMTSAYLGDKITNVNVKTFYGCENLSSVHIPAAAKSIEKEAFEGCASLETVHIPSAVADIMEHAFDGCTSLTDLELNEGLLSIGKSAFSKCSGFETLRIPNTVKEIGRDAFEFCQGLKELVIGNGVVDMGRRSFYGCSNLQRVVVGEHVQTMGMGTFHKCVKVDSVFVLAVNPPAHIHDIEGDPLFHYDVYETAILIVPENMSDAYKDARSWSSFKSIYEAGHLVNDYPLTIKANAGGRVSVNELIVADQEISQNVAKGETLTLVVVPDCGYKIASLTVNEQEVVEEIKGNSYKVVMENPVAVNVTFEKLPVYSLTIQHAENGSVSWEVVENTEHKFHIDVAKGWKVNSVTFNGEDVTADLDSDNCYTTSAITGNSVLNVSLESDDVSGVDEVGDAEISVRGYRGHLWVNGVPRGENITVYAIDGSIVDHVISNGVEYNTDVQEDFTYIVQVGQRTFKIRL